MIDRTNFFLCLFLATLLLIIFYMPKLGSLNTRQPDSNKAGGEQELARFQDIIRKFVKSMGDIENRLKTLEDSVEKIVEKQETLEKHVKERQQTSNNIPVKRAAEKPAAEKPAEQAENIEAKHDQEANFENFYGEIKRDNNCFDSAEHGEGGIIEIWACHKQGRNQEFRLQEGMIKHKSWCLAVEKAQPGESVVLKDCTGNTFLQEWQYHDRLFKAGETNFCMSNKSGSGAVTLAECNSEDTSQQWHLERT